MIFLPWIIVVVTILVVSYLDRWENRYIKSVFDWIPAILLAYIIPALATYFLKTDYSEHYIHNYSRDYFIPLAIIAVMSSLSLGQLKSVGIKPILLFAGGSAFISLFPIIFFWGFSSTNLVNDTMILNGFWRGLPPIVGSWIGGSTSQLVLKEIVECPEEIFLSVLVLDNVLVNIWTVLMFQAIKRSHSLNRFLKISDKGLPQDIRSEAQNPVAIWVTTAVLIGVVLVINEIIESFIFKVILLSIIGLILGNFVPKWNYRFSLRMGAILILLVMAVLGLKLRFDAFEINLPFFGFLIIWLVGHYVFMMLLAKALNINMAWVPIASMANVGGIATAPAVTAAYEKRWMPHAVVLAILSMATGTFWGMLTIYFLKIFIKV